MKRYATLIALLLAGCTNTQTPVTDSAKIETNEEPIQAISQVEEQITLTVLTNPSDSRVRIMNIKPKYVHGIELNEGKYDIYVTKKGFKSKRVWVDVNKATVLHVTLSELDSASESTVKEI